MSRKSYFLRKYFHKNIYKTFLVSWEVMTFFSYNCHNDTIVISNCLAKNRILCIDLDKEIASQWKSCNFLTD